MVQSVPARTRPARQIIQGRRRKWYSPIVLKLAQEAKISQAELDAIPGTGYEGRLSKKILKIISRPRKVASPHKVIPKTCVNRRRSPPSPIDVTHHLRSMVSTITNRRSPPSTIDATRHLSPKTKRSKWTALPVSYQTIWSCRKKVSPHVTTVVEADVTRLVKWRKPHERRIFKREGVALTFMPAIAEATAKALAEFPHVNASVDGYKVILKKHINLGIAVSLPDGNLIVPVIHDADKLNLNGLAANIDTLAAKARTGKLDARRYTRRNFHDHQLRFVQEPVRYADHQPATGSHLRRRLHRKKTGRRGDTRRRYNRNSPQRCTCPCRTTTGSSTEHWVESSCDA